MARFSSDQTDTWRGGSRQPGRARPRRWERRWIDFWRETVLPSAVAAFSSPADNPDPGWTRPTPTTRMFAVVRRAVLFVSVLACLALLSGQLGAYLDFVLVPAPTATTNGPQSSADLWFGLLAVGGGGLGFLLSIAAGILGLVVAAGERRTSWVIAICVAGAIVVVGFAVSAFVLLGLPRNPYHPFTVLLLVPVTTLTFTFFARLPVVKAPR